MRTAAQVVAYIFHPLLFASYLVLVLGMYMPQFLLIPRQALYSFLALVFIMTFVLPALNLGMFRVFGTIRSLELDSRKERLLPFFLITIIYGVVSFMFFYKMSVNINFNKLMLLVAALVLAATIGTLFMKISVHSLAISGAVGILLPLNQTPEGVDMLFPTLAVIVLAGVVMSSRLYLNKHTPREVLYGASTGFGVGFFGMNILF